MQITRVLTLSCNSRASISKAHCAVWLLHLQYPHRHLQQSHRHTGAGDGITVL